MEFLVEMTTRVPDGVSDESVGEVRAREAAHSRELADQGSLLRLFRPPLQPGEWRTLGLFAAPNDAHLESVLASMPLRIWRTDKITPLAAHPNDPDRQNASTISGPEFLVIFSEVVPDGMSPQLIDEQNAKEREAARQLAEQGHLERLWKLPADGTALGLWRARDTDEMQAILSALPFKDWLRTEIVKLDVHPSDPMLSRSQTNC